MDKIPVIAVVGPTASGKTALAVEIAKRYSGEIVSADSMQIYQQMNIATAKPTEEEKQGIPHHLMDFLPPGQSFNVADYAQLAHRRIQSISDSGKLPILAGGTGLYVDSVLNDIRFSEAGSDPDLRKKLAETAQTHGSEELLRQLAEVDSETAAGLHSNNLGRIIRAIEVYQLTGVAMSEHQRKSREQPSRYRALMLGLDFRDRSRLYDRINQRVDRMLAQGLLEEAEHFLRDAGSKTSRQAIGYKELAGYFSGEVPLEEAVERLKRETRHYAKRQLTWFKRNLEIQWFYPDEEKWEILEKNIWNCIDNFLKI